MTNLAGRGTSLVLGGWFAFASAALVLAPVLAGGPISFGSEAVAGAHAAAALLAGGNPWAPDNAGMSFTGLPTGLLPYVPFAVLPDWLVAALWVAIGVGSSIYAVRRLQLPVWWLLFPPLVAGIVAGGPVPLILALLLRAGRVDDLRGTVAGAAAFVLRPYAALPLLAIGRWRGPVLGLDIAFATAPLLATAAFLVNLPTIGAMLNDQVGGGLSATVSYGTFMLAAVGLIALGPRRSAWLLVPALWPSAPFALAALALPVAAEVPLVAAALSSPVTPGLIAYGIAAQSAVEGLKLRQLRRADWRRPPQRRWRPDEVAAHYERRARRGAAEPQAATKRG